MQTLLVDLEKEAPLQCLHKVTVLLEYIDLTLQSIYVRLAIED